MSKIQQALGMFIVAVVSSCCALSAAVTWGPHHCDLRSISVVGCSIGSYEALTGGLLAAWAALFAGWMAWTAVQVQIGAEERRAIADRIEVESVLERDIDEYADGLAAIWKLLNSIEDVSKERTKVDGIVWGINRIANPQWLDVSRQMVTVLGWQRRRDYEQLFTAIAELGTHNDAANLDVSETLSEVETVASWMEVVAPSVSEYFEGMWRRSPKAWTLGYRIQVEADSFVE